MYAYSDRALDQQRHQLQADVQQIRAQVTELTGQRDILEGRLAVETSTRKGLEVTLDVVQNQLGAAREQIAFFEELLPPGPVGSVSIRALDFQQKGSTLEYRVLLMRNGANPAPFDGMLEFQASGHAANEAVTVDLEPVRARTVKDNDAASASTLALQFDQFQRSAGLLQVPEGMTLDEVTLNVLEGQTLRTSRTVNLSSQASD